MGFTKLDEGILQSSIMAEDGNTFKVWIALLAACKENGLAPLSALYLSTVCHLSIEEIEKSLLKLESPDKHSRTTDKEGRRIERINGGYLIINYLKYRKYTYSDTPSAVRQRRHRKRDMSHNVTNERDISDINNINIKDNKELKEEYIDASLHVTKIKKVKENVEKIYSMYPTRDQNNNNRSLGKCYKDKKKIEIIFKRMTAEELIKIMTSYLSECKRTKAWLKNFSVFLNQLPEPLPTEDIRKSELNDHPSFRPIKVPEVPKDEFDGY